MLESMADPTARALRLLSLLQTHRFWTGDDLADELGVTTRTLRRDVDRLRELGYRVEASAGVGGGYQLAQGSALPPLLLDDDEAVAVSVGLRTASGASVAGMEDASLRAMAKLEQVLPDRLRRRVRALHANVSTLPWTGPDDTVEPEALALLAQACRDREQVRFAYVARDGAATDRLIEPHRLVTAGRRWYLAAFDLRRDDWRTFRVDRLADVRLAGVRFTPRRPPGGSVEAYVAEALGSRPTHEVTLLLHASVDEVHAAGPLRTLPLEAVAPSRTRVTLRSDSVEWLLGQVAVFAAVHVLDVEGPPAMVDAVARVAGRLERRARTERAPVGR